MVEGTDQTQDPQLKSSLLQARRGTAFWHRKVEELTDIELDSSTLLSGWTRRHLIAHVGYNARAITRLVTWANTGIENPMYESPLARDQEINAGATLPAHALRNLNYHAAVSLNVEWRDTPDDRWLNHVKTAQGRDVPLSETVWMRIREVWLHAIDLNNGAKFSDIPDDILTALLQDIVRTWDKRRTNPGYAIHLEDRDDIGAFNKAKTDPTILIRGNLASVVAWATGRGGDDLIEGQDVMPPKWL